MNEQPRFDTHVCLVSGQATPNLTPAIDPAFAPRHVVLLVSKDMRSRAESLARVLKRREISLTALPVPDPYDYFGVEDILLSWLSEHEGDAVALNVTGGTKVMAMAAQEVFRASGKPVFYVNIENDEVLFLGQKQASFKLGHRIKLRDFLEAHGYSLEGAPSRPGIEAWERDLTTKLAYDLGQIGKGLGELNWLAQEARGSLRSPELTDAQGDSKQLDELIYRFSGENQLKLEGRRLIFPSELARSFVNGGWLERYVFRTLADLAPNLGLTEYAIGLKVVAPDGATRNEIDAAFLYRNRLHLIECKTANLASPGRGGDSKGADAVYKLENLRKMGGIAAKGMLIDYRGSLSDADRKRAQESGIAVVGGNQVRNLAEKIRDWVRT